RSSWFGGTASRRWAGHCTTPMSSCTWTDRSLGDSFSSTPRGHNPVQVARRARREGHGRGPGESGPGGGERREGATEGRLANQAAGSDEPGAAVHRRLRTGMTHPPRGGVDFLEGGLGTMSFTRFSMCVALLGTIMICALGGEARVAAQDRNRGAGEKDG